MDRRRFLHRTGALAAGTLGVGGLVGSGAAQEARRSRVASIHGPGAQPANGRLVKSKVLEMVDTAVSLTTGEGSAAKAWESLFSSDDVIAIKVNVSGGPSLSSNNVIVDAITKRLADTGVSLDNVLVYDRTDEMLAACGYELNTGAGLKCGGVEGYWDEKVTKQGKYTGRLATVLKHCSAIINVPILKDAPVGVTAALKNHFGTIENPSECHGNMCDPYIADVNAIPAIKDKQRIVICDATSACFEGGPGADPRYIWRPNRILAATDPVALDTIGAQMINEKRVEQGMKTLEEAGKPPKLLASAAVRGVGTNNMSLIDLLERDV